MSAVETAAPVDAAKAPEVAKDTVVPTQEPAAQPAPEVAKEATTEPAEPTPAAAPSDAPVVVATPMAEPTETAPVETAPKVEEAAPKVEEKEEEEPQNELTKKFTEKEWAALKEFRVCYMLSDSVTGAHRLRWV